MFDPPPFLEMRYGGLHFKPLTLCDAPPLLEALRESLPELKRFLPFAHEPQTVESQQEKIAAADALRLAVREGSRLVCACGLHPRVPLNPQGVEIGWWVRSSEAGRGLATRVTQALLICCFEFLHMDRVQIAHNPANGASQRVIEKIGFVLEGRVRNSQGAPPAEAIAAGLSPCRDVLSYSLLPDEARALPWYHKAAQDLEIVAQAGFIHATD